MYIASYLKNGQENFVIRMSCYDDQDDCLRYTDVFDLGVDPRNFLEHPAGSRVFLFNEDLEEAMEAREKGSAGQLEEMFEPFLTSDERYRMSHARCRTTRRLTPLTADEKDQIQRNIHIFDRRRLYYIRYGAVDQSRIYRVNEKIYRPLVSMCRDEKECYFREQEKVLAAAEMKKYIYVIFNVQQCFDENFSAVMPEALNPEEVDDAFVKQLCQLNGDRSFWQGEPHGRFLHPHLHRYVTRFFDLEYQRPSFARDFAYHFRESHRRFRWPEKAVFVSDDEVSNVFGEKTNVLKKMSSTELARLFRKKAKEHHPDSGGDPDQFILLRNAYESLKRRG